MSVLGKSIRLKERWMRYADAIIEKALRNRYAERSDNSLLLNDMSAANFQADLDAEIALHDSVRNVHNTTAEDIGAYSSAEQQARAQAYLHRNAIPLDRYGDLSFLPVAVTGTYEGTTSLMMNRQSVLHLEKDNTLVMIRNATDGKSIGAYYSFMLNALNRTDLPDMIKTASPYEPSFMQPFAEKVAYVYDVGDNGMLAGRFQTTSGTLLDEWFITMREDTLDGKKHTWHRRLNAGSAAALSLPFNNMHDILLHSELILVGNTIYMLTYNRHQVYIRRMSTSGSTFTIPSTTRYIQYGNSTSTTPTGSSSGEVGLFTHAYYHEINSGTSPLIRTNQEIVHDNGEPFTDQAIFFDPETNAGTKGYTSVEVNEDTGVISLYLSMYAQIRTTYVEQVDELPAGRFSLRAGINWFTRIDIDGGLIEAYPDGAKTNIQVNQNATSRIITIPQTTNCRQNDWAWPYTQYSRLAAFYCIALKTLNSGRHAVFVTSNGNVPDANLSIEKRIMYSTVAKRNVFKGSNLNAYTISFANRGLTPQYGSVLKAQMRIVGLTKTGIIATLFEPTLGGFRQVFAQVNTGTQVTVPSLTYPPGYLGYNLTTAARQTIGSAVNRITPITFISGSNKDNWGTTFISGLKTSGYVELTGDFSTSGSASMTSAEMNIQAELLIDAYNANAAAGSRRMVKESYKVFVAIPKELAIPAFIVVAGTDMAWTPPAVEGEEGTYDPLTKQGVYIMGVFEPTARSGTNISALPLTLRFLIRSNRQSNLALNDEELADFETLTTTSVLMRFTGIWIYETPAGYYVGGTIPIVLRQNTGNGVAGDFLCFYQKADGQVFTNYYFGVVAAQDISDTLIALPNRGLGAQALNWQYTDSGTKVIADMHVQEPTDIPTTFGRVRVRPEAQAQWFVPLSTQMELGFRIHFTQDVPCFMQGNYRLISAQSLNLAAVTGNPANRTFAIFINLNTSTGVITYSAELAVGTNQENINKMFIGTVTTGQSSVIAINIIKTTRFGGVAVTSEARGNAIPASAGLPMEHAQLEWR